MLIAQIPGTEEAISSAAKDSWVAVLLVVILFAIGFAFWRTFTWFRDKMFEAPHGLVVRYVGATESFLKNMEARDLKQQELCAAHADNLSRIADISDTQQELMKGTHDAIRSLVARAESPDAPFSTVQTNRDMTRFKKAATHACEMCRHICEREFPDSATEVKRLTGEIERIIGES